ncbi:MAG: hypothetical protein M1514_01340 [Patescibacteria group bacterium]|nr:hypothetical protein [Patescibacteria group bacterium]
MPIEGTPTPKVRKEDPSGKGIESNGSAGIEFTQKGERIFLRSRQKPKDYLDITPSDLPQNPSRPTKVAFPYSRSGPFMGKGEKIMAVAQIIEGNPGGFQLAAGLADFNLYSQESTYITNVQGMGIGTSPGDYKIVAEGITPEAVKKGKITLESPSAQEMLFGQKVGFDTVIILEDKNKPQQIRYSVLIVRRTLADLLKKHSLANLILKKVKKTI